MNIPSHIRIKGFAVKRGLGRRFSCICGDHGRAAGEEAEVNGTVGRWLDRHRGCGELLQPQEGGGSMIRLTILGAPRTKGNHGIVTHGIIIPSPQYRRWFKAAMQQAPILYGEAARQAPGTMLPIAGKVNVAPVFYLDANRAVDEDNLKKGLGDFLKRGKRKPFGVGIVEDDRLIHWREIVVLVDRANPRIDVTIEPVPATRAA